MQTSNNMTQVEALITTAEKLYKCRTAARKLHGEKYPVKITYYQNYIRAYMAKHSTSDELAAAIGLCDECKGMDGAGMFTMMIMAAAVEMIEPS